MIFLITLTLFIVLLIVLFIVDKQYRAEYIPVACTEIERTAIDQSIMVLHMYAQLLYGHPISFRKKIIENRFYIHYPKPKSMVKNWYFHPIHGSVGFQGWENYFMYKHTMVGFISVNHEKKMLTLVFRNSRTLADFVHNFDLSYRENRSFSFKGSMHAGYITIFMSYVKQLHDLLDEVIAKTSHIKDYTLLLTGHSLGGALATLTAAYLVDHKKYKNYFGMDNMKLVTFGAPYVGTKSSTHDFTEWMQAHIGYIRCFERSTDLAPVFSRFFKIQTPKRLTAVPPQLGIIKPVPPGKVLPLFHYHASRLNFRSGHCIVKYRKAIYRELKLVPCKIYTYLL